MKFPTDKEIENEVKINIEKSINKCLDNKEPIKALIDYIKFLGDDLIQYRIYEKKMKSKAYQEAR